MTAPYDTGERTRRVRVAFAWVPLLVAAACASTSGRAAIATPAGVSPSASFQALYESGEDREIVNRMAARGAGAAAPADRWFAAQSKLRLGLRDDALSDLTALSQAQDDAAMQVAAQLAIGRLTNDETALGEARANAGAYPGNVFVQYELGLSYVVASDFQSAARAFDLCVDTAPMFAYAYYQSALAYQRLNRPDVMANRLDRFARLAPNAPERPQVDSILRTLAAGRQ